MGRIAATTGFLIFSGLSIACGDQSQSGPGATPGASDGGSKGAPGSDATAPSSGDAKAPNTHDAKSPSTGDATMPPSDSGQPQDDEDAGGHMPTIGPFDAQTDAAPFDWVGIIGTGQSLSLGWASTAISTTQPFKNITLLDTGPDPKYPIDGSAAAVWSTTPLIEPARVWVPDYPMGGNDDYPDNLYAMYGVYGETPHSGFANTMSALWQSRGLGDYVTAHSIVGVGGACLNYLNKETGPVSYFAALSEARVFKKLAASGGKTYGVGAILLTHGECDAQTDPTYEADVFQFWQDYNTDLKAITGQTKDIVLIGSQESSVAGGPTVSAVQLWQAGVDHPGQIIVAGPKYQYGDYYLHMDAPGYERLGEKYAEVFDLVVNRGVAWKPVGPSSVSQSGDTITVTFDVPNPPLVWDTHLVPPHQMMNTAWANGNGFEVTDGDGNELTISSATIQSNTVVLKLAKAPAAGTALNLAYAVTADGGEGNDLGGDPMGMHGLLRDSDDFLGYSGMQTIPVTVTNGSTTVNPAGSTDLSHVGAMDMVTGTGVPNDTVVVDESPTEIDLSVPWPGASGTVMMTFRHTQYNYAVHFAMAVPQ
jgi:hypothetical protein